MCECHHSEAKSERERGRKRSEIERNRDKIEELWKLRKGIETYVLGFDALH